MQKLNERERTVYEYIVSEIRDRGYAPSVREICSAIGVKSSSCGQRYLDRLEEYGYISRSEGKNRTIRLENVDTVSPVSVPILGQVTAGEPIIALEHLEGYIGFTPVLKHHKYAPEKLFALRIKGESMIGAGILDRDTVIVEQTPTAENGDIVVALIDDSATVKRFFKEDGHFRLQPENDSMKPIIVDSVVILGRVVAVQREY